jgi:hypothetical protein
MVIEIPFDSNQAVFSSLPFEYGAPVSIIKGQDGYVMLGNFPQGRYLYYQPSTGKAKFFGDYRVYLINVGGLTISQRVRSTLAAKWQSNPI